MNSFFTTILPRPFLPALFIFFSSVLWANKQDTVYLFSYSENDGRSGLLLAWSLDQQDWHAIGPGHRFLGSDFGSWGSQKRMYAPFLFHDKQDHWHCIWSLNDEVPQFAHAMSEDLIEWKRQSYPVVMTQGNVMEPEVAAGDGEYIVSWISAHEGGKKIYTSRTADFKHYSSPEEATHNDRQDLRREAEIGGVKHSGVINRVPWELVETLLKHQEWSQFHHAERAELMQDDPVRFAGLEQIAATIQPEPEKAKEISDMLIGIFFEDISYAADGGIYAELVQNRGFEYQLSDKKHRDPSWTPEKAWSFSDETGFTIDTIDPVHGNNKHYAVIASGKPGAVLANEGWDGIFIGEGKKYDFSCFARSGDAKKGKLTIRLVDEAGNIAGESTVRIQSDQWKKYSTVLVANRETAHAELQVIPEFAGRVDLDMISLFPQHTFNNRKNGLRADLAQMIADMQPKFIRFPGGCVAHGDGLSNLYLWENTVGPPEQRVPQRNIWNYHQSAGLGYYEYFQFCEDIGAEPIPVVPAGVPCQNSAVGGHGQQCGIPMEEMDQYVQSVLDLVEWANGDKNSAWGRVRAQAGHPEPFNLKYIGVGNEDLITDVFEARFTMIYEALQEHHPEITVIGTVGPFYMGTDYEEGWDIARKLDLPMVDEHYYQPPGWFINNQDFYDKYERDATKVYLGEYAAHVPGRKRNMETALSEALYLISLERNADVVSMTSYAPLLAKKGYENWNPNLVYFDNTGVYPSVGYYVQQLFGQHPGDRYVPVQVNLTNRQQNVGRRFGVSIVEEESTGDIIIKLANLLPVSVDAAVDLSGFSFHPEGRCIVLQGEPHDEHVVPAEEPIRVGGHFEYTVPEYSFSVIRLKGKS